MSKLTLSTDQITDYYVRENFKNLKEFINIERQLNGFMFFEYTFTTNGTIEKTHSLGFVPKDVIETSKTGTGTVVYNYTSFSKDVFNFTVAAATEADPVTVRFFSGTYSTSGVTS